MAKDTFVEGVDDLGHKFIEYASYEKQKKHPGDLNAVSYRPEARIYARPGDRLCPVGAFTKYVSLLHPHSDDLWQRPSTTNWQQEGRSWYY